MSNAIHQRRFHSRCGCQIVVHFRTDIMKRPWQIKKTDMCRQHKAIHKQAKKQLKEKRLAQKKD